MVLKATSHDGSALFFFYFLFLIGPPFDVSLRNIKFQQ